MELLECFTKEELICIFFLPFGVLFSCLIRLHAGYADELIKYCNYTPLRSVFQLPADKSDQIARNEFEILQIYSINVRFLS